jgi:hypothetical protein
LFPYLEGNGESVDNADNEEMMDVAPDHPG